MDGVKSDCATNSTSANEADDQVTGISAFVYIVVVMLFYSSAMVLLVVKYLRWEQRDASLNHFFHSFVRRESFQVLFWKQTKAALVERNKTLLDKLSSRHTDKVTEVVLAVSEMEESETYDYHQQTELKSLSTSSCLSTAPSPTDIETKMLPSRTSTPVSNEDLCIDGDYSSFEPVVLCPSDKFQPVTLPSKT